MFKRQADKIVLSKLTKFSQETLVLQKGITVVQFLAFDRIQSGCLELGRPDETALSKLTDFGQNIIVRLYFEILASEIKLFTSILECK